MSRGLTYVLVVVLIVVGAQVVVGSALGSSPVYVVVSKSMVPTLQIGDLVITESVAYSNIHVGQVIVFVNPDSEGTCPNPYGLTVVHRVVAVTPSGLITQGDDRTTNPRPDEPDSWPPVPPECVKGVVVLAVPYLGLISMLIPYPWNYALVGLILIFVFLSELRPSTEGAQEGNQSKTSGGPSGVAQGNPGASSRRRGLSPLPSASSRTTC